MRGVEVATAADPPVAVGSGFRMCGAHAAWAAATDRVAWSDRFLAESATDETERDTDDTAARASAEIAERPGSHAARLHALKDDVLRNLEHGDVSIDAISARHRMSPRHVQRLFGREGSTFSEFVLERRLAFAHRMLTDPRRSAEKIASMAFAAGFGDLSYFYRVFRRRYDALPSDVRATARRPN